LGITKSFSHIEIKFMDFFSIAEKNHP